MERTWWKEAVVYQIYPRSFNDSNGDGIGDLNGITEKMDYLKKLGIDVIWLSPVYESPNDDNGYDISNYRGIMKDFGTMEDFDRMLAAAHERGIRIVMDLVVNHTSDEHPWFVESRKSKDNPYRDYYIWREGKNGKEPNNWGSCFSGPAWEYDGQISKVPELPDGKVGKNGYGDYGPYVCNGPHVHEYLQEMNRRVLSRYDLLTVGECSGVTVEEAKKYASLDGKELNMVFQFEHMDLDGGETFKWNERKIKLTELKQVLTKWQTSLMGKAWNSLYWCNHDQPRMLSRLGNDSPQYREVSAKMLATCLHMMQGTPYVYQGEELGMTNVPFQTLEDFRDIESINAYHELVGQGVIDGDTMMRYLRYKSRDNARTPMQWNDSENAGFTEGTPWIMVNPNYKEINAEEELAREDSVFYYYQKLIRLRHENPVIVYGDYKLLLPEHEALYAYTRELDGETLLVICNFSSEEQKMDLPEEFSGKEGTVLISNYEDSRPEEHMTLRAYEAAVYRF